jgi:hypothetical protein
LVSWLEERNIETGMDKVAFQDAFLASSTIFNS